MRNLDTDLVKSSKIRAIRTGNILEVFEYQYAYWYNFAPSVKGDVESFENEEGRRMDSIVRAQTKIRRLVNANSFVWGYQPIFVTYTFRENITDIVEANTMFTSHMRMLKKRIGKHLRYVAVPEIQGSRLEKYGVAVWHFHVVFFDLPFIYGIKNIFAEEWEHGFVQVKSIKHVKNVGAYISKYFSKQWAESRAKGKKSFFSSFGLYQPVVHYSLLTALPDKCKLNEEYSSEYVSEKYGRVVYKQYKIEKNAI